jgi:parvulin-like peptidyl-prolyl isomerase
MEINQNMKTKMKLAFSAALGTMLFAFPSAQAAAANGSTNTTLAGAGTNSNPEAAITALFGNPVIAKGKGFEIKRSELDEVMTGLKSAAAAHGQAIPPGQMTRIESQLLDRLIQIQLLMQKATAADRTNGTQKANLQITALLERAGSQEALNRQMKAIGMTMAELRSKVTQENTAQAVLTRELNVTVTDAEAKQFYDGHPADFEQPEMAHVRHILLMTMDPVTRAPLPADQQQAKHKQIDDLLKRIQGGADFAALAKQYSEDPGSKDNGGELPAFSRGQMVPEFEAAAFSLTNNQVSAVVTTTYGYHIIKLIDKTPAKKVGYVTVTARIKDFLTQQKTEKLAPAYLDKLKREAGVEILDADLKAAAAAAAANAPTEMPEK